MRKNMGVLLAALLTVTFQVNTWADAGKQQSVDYKTDYYMVVESQDGGVNMYAEPDVSSSVLNDEPIPNGAAFYIEGETKENNGQEWAYTQYHNMNGYVQTDDLTPVTRKQAAEYEIYLYGWKDKSYDLTVDAKDGGISLYNGPGKKYDTVSGSAEIPNGQTVSIVGEVDAGEDGIWGKTDVDGLTGWISVTEATGEETNGSVDMETDAVDIQEAESANEAAAVSAETSAAESTPTEKPTKAPTRKPTATPEPSAEPTSTPTPAVEPTATSAAEKTRAVTPTAEPSPTAASAAKDTHTVTPTAEPASTATPTAESTQIPAATKDMQVTSTPEPTQTEIPVPEPTDEAVITGAPVAKTEPTVTEKPAIVEDTEEVSAQADARESRKPVAWIVAALVVLIAALIACIIRIRNEY